MSSHAALGVVRSGVAVLKGSFGPFPSLPFPPSMIYSSYILRPLLPLPLPPIPKFDSNPSPTPKYQTSKHESRQRRPHQLHIPGPNRHRGRPQQFRHARYDRSTATGEYAVQRGASCLPSSQHPSVSFISLRNSNLLITFYTVPARHHRSRTRGAPHRSRARGGVFGQWLQQLYHGGKSGGGWGCFVRFSPVFLFVCVLAWVVFGGSVQG